MAVLASREAQKPRAHEIAVTTPNSVARLNRRWKPFMRGRESAAILTFTQFSQVIAARHAVAPVAIAGECRDEHIMVAKAKGY